MGAFESAPEQPPPSLDYPYTVNNYPDTANVLITADDIKMLRMLHCHVHVASVEIQTQAACLLANLAENGSVF